MTKAASKVECVGDAVPVLRAEMDFVVALLRDAKTDRVPIPAVEMVYAAVTTGQLATTQVLRDAEELVACERLVAAAPARLRGLMGPMLEESRRDLALRWVQKRGLHAISHGFERRHADRTCLARLEQPCQQLLAFETLGDGDFRRGLHLLF